MFPISSFNFRASDEQIKDLHTRLDQTRLPELETVQDASQGVKLNNLQMILRTWRSHDWRKLESRLDAIGQFKAYIDGLNISFWHLKSSEPTAIPLILTHGWPGSVLEFEGVVDLLTDPAAHGGTAEDAFNVVVPSLPGFGFSDRPQETGWTPERTARAWAHLMTVLGYQRFAAHGGDWGASVSIELARLVPERVFGLHLTMPFASPLPEDYLTTDIAEMQMLEKRHYFMKEEVPFALLQSTRPQTLGYSLVDSPAGLAAWLSEKVAAFAGADSGVSVERQVDNIALYWFTATGASAARWYWEAARSRPSDAQEENSRSVSVPTACSLFPGEPYPIARRWAARRFSNLISWNEMESGGHFPGWEQPAVLVSELRQAFRHARKPR